MCLSKAYNFGMRWNLKVFQLLRAYCSITKLMSEQTTKGTPSVRLSHVFHYVTLIIMTFSGVITNDQSKVYAKGQGQGSRVKVTKAKTLLNRFRTVTPVWIHIWWWNDAHSLIFLRRDTLLFFSRSPVKFQGHTAQKSNFTQIRRFRTVTPVWIHQWLWNDAQSLKQHTRGALLFFKVICQIARSQG